MIHDSLFSPSQSPVFVLFRVLVSPSSKSRFRSLKVPFSSHLKVLSHPPPSPAPVLSDSRDRPLPSSQSPLPSSQIPVPVLFPPPRAKENSGTTRSRPAVRCVVSSKMEHDIILLVYGDADFRRLFVLPLHFGEGFANKFNEVEANVREPFTLMLSGLRKI